MENIINEILKNRRSIRKFQKKAIETYKIEQLKESLLRSPSSRNIKPWKFIFVEDRKLIFDLSKAKKHGSDFLSEVPLAIVICGDKYLSDVWIEDCSIASILVQLSAQVMDLSSCWVQIRNRQYDNEQSSCKYIKQLIGIKSDMNVLSVIGIGYPDESKEPIPFKELDFKKIILK